MMDTWLLRVGIGGCGDIISIIIIGIIITIFCPLRAKVLITYRSNRLNKGTESLYDV